MLETHQPKNPLKITKSLSETTTFPSTKTGVASLSGGYATQRTHMHRMKEICMRFLENVGHMKSFAPWVQNKSAPLHSILPLRSQIAITFYFAE